MDHKNKVIIIIGTGGGVHPETLDSALSQAETIVHVCPPKAMSDYIVANKVLNVTRMRQECRELALSLNAGHYLLLDSDVVLPPNAVREFLKQKGFACQGGWYPGRSGGWVAGRWLKKGAFYHYQVVPRGVVETDMIGLGCAFLDRRVLKRVKFEAGVDHWCYDMNGQKLLFDESGMFSMRCQQLGYALWMNGSVVCHHLTTQENEINEPTNRRGVSGAPGVQSGVPIQDETEAQPQPAEAV